MIFPKLGLARLLDPSGGILFFRECAHFKIGIQVCILHLGTKSVEITTPGANLRLDTIFKRFSMSENLGWLFHIFVIVKQKLRENQES